jgi:hypothetical protein
MGVAVMETLWQFIAVAGNAASIAGAILAWQTRDTKKFLERMDARHLAQHTQTQAMIERMDQRHSQSQRESQQILERMDQRAEERYRDLRGRMDGEV